MTEQLQQIQEKKPMVRRQIPVFAAGLYVKSVDIIESAQNLLTETRPELLQLDLTKNVGLGQWDDLATECIDEIIKINNLQDEIASVDTKDLENSFNPDYIFIGCGMINIKPDETQTQFFHRVLESIKKTGIKLDFEPIDTDEERDNFDNPTIAGKIEMGVIADIRTYYSPPEFEGEIDEIDEAYDNGYREGFKLGVSETYDSMIVSLYKTNVRKKFAKNMYLFLEDLRGTFVGMTNVESEIWKQKLTKYINKAKTEEINKDEKENENA